MAESYDEFVEKFKTKKTTDDCFTPPTIYEAVLDYVCRRFGVSRETVVRPFYPGGDYKAEDYTGKVVVDNPPFSILSEILTFYRTHNVPAFLFVPGLNANSEQLKNWTTIVTTAPIRYENGANVRTAFVTNLGSGVNAFETSRELSQAIKDATPFRGKIKKPRPANIITVPDLQTEAKRTEFTIKHDEILGVDRKFYGPGLIVSRETIGKLKGD